MNISRNAGTRKAAAASSVRWKGWCAAIVVLALCIVGAAAVYARFREDPDLVALRQVDEEIAALERSENPQPDDAMVIEALRMVRQEKLEALSDAQRAVLDQRRDAQRETWEAEREARIDAQLTAFFALPAAERLAAIDKMIAAEEAGRRAWEERQANRDVAAGGAGQGAAGQGGRPPGGPANAAGGRGGTSPRGPRGPSTPERRKERERRRLDRSTPQYRAQRTEFARLVQQRRQEQGLPPASMRQVFGMYRRLAGPPSGPAPMTAASPRS